MFGPERLSIEEFVPRVGGQRFSASGRTEDDAGLSRREAGVILSGHSNSR
jgi:hypothetical protein